MITSSRGFGFLCSLVVSSSVFTNVGSLNCRQQSLLWHNYYRIHQVPNVSWSWGLRKKAKDWADYLAEKNLFVHEKKDPGNLFLSAGKPAEPCTAAVKAFYTEEKLYDYRKPEQFKGAGHFTQVVWKNTKYIGAFYKTRSDGKTVVVMKYSPGGNVRGYFAKNVFPPRKPIIVTSPWKFTGVTTADRTSTGNATFRNLTTLEPKRDVTAGATSLRVWIGMHFAFQCFFVGFRFLC